MITRLVRRVCARIAWAAVKFSCTLRSLLDFTWSKSPASVRVSAERVSADLDELMSTRNASVRKIIVAECLEHAEQNRVARRMAGRRVGCRSNAAHIRALVICINKRMVS